MKKLLKHTKNRDTSVDFLPFVLISISLVVTAIWFRRGLMYGGGETQIPFYNPKLLVEMTSSSWIEIAGLGVPGTVWFPSHHFWIIISKIHEIVGWGFITQAIFFFLVFCTGAVSVYYLDKEFFNNNKFISFVAGIFYIFNPFMQSTVWHRFLLPIMALSAVMPLLLVLVIKSLKSRNIFYSLIIPIVMNAWGIIYIFPGSVVTLSIPIAIYIIFFAYQKRNSKSDLMFLTTFIIATALFWLSINLWWIIPFKQTASGILNSATDLEGYIGSLRGVSLENTLSYSLRSISPHYFIYEPGWGSIYSTWYFSIISFFGLLVSIVGVVKGWKKNVWIKYLFAVSILGVFLIKGTNPPFGEAFYRFIFEYIPPSRIFRNPNEKLGLIVPLSYSLLFGYGIYEIYNKFKRDSNIWAVTVTSGIIISYCGIYVWPMWVGNVINFSVDDPAYVEVPHYYDELDNYFIENSADHRVIALPLMGHGIYHTWEHGYRGGDLTRDLFNNATLSRTIDFADRSLLHHMLDDTSKDWFYNFLPYLDTKYIYVRNDIDHESLSVKDPDWIISNIESKGILNLVVKKENYSLFEVPKELKRGKIYSSDDILLVKDLDELSLELQSGSPQSFLLGAENKYIAETDDDLDRPSIFYTKISPSRYRVNIEGAEDDYYLIFSESYHPGWNIKLDGNIQPHFKINGYANGYYINKEGNYDLEIVFSGENDYELGVYWGKILSVVSILIVVLFLIKKNYEKSQS